jgi:hypothetical protein
LAYRSGDALPRNPITGIAGCCARAAAALAQLREYSGGAGYSV